MKVFFKVFLLSIVIYLIGGLIFNDGNNIEVIILPMGLVIIVLLSYIISLLHDIKDK